MNNFAKCVQGVHLLRHRRLENSLATTQNSPTKFCMFAERALPFHNNNNPPVPLNSVFLLIQFVMKTLHAVKLSPTHKMYFPWDTELF